MTSDDVFTTTIDAFTDASSTDALTSRLLEHVRPRDVDVVWTTHETLLGRLLLAFRDDAVVRIAFESEGFDAVLDDLGERLGRRTLRSPRRADTLRRQLDLYFTGVRVEFSVTPDLSLSTAPFRREVQSSLPTIPYGRTISYADLASSTGRPRAVRAVGSACASNPLPIVLPCHRVVRSDGSLGNYLGGVEAKQRLLELESAAAP